MKRMKHLLCLTMLAIVLIGMTAFHASAAGVVSGSVEKKAGYDVASVRLVYADESYDIAELIETASGYSYSIADPGKSYTVEVEYFSTSVWDGAVDISWYDENSSVYEISTPAQLAGLAALVNGGVDVNTPDYRIKGDRTLLQSTVEEEFSLPGSVEDSVNVGLQKFNFADKTILLTADMDMGGESEATNWVPIGGLFSLAPLQNDYKDHMVSSWFGGVLDGQGHRITNLYCNRHVEDWSYSQGCGFVGALDIYEDQAQPTLAPTIRNLSVDGIIYGNRMVGGIAGRIGDTAKAAYIENCANYAAVTCTDSKGIGGIVGSGWAQSGAIINCYNTGDITTTLAQTPGGGIIGSDSCLNIYSCYNIGTITTAGGRGRGIGGHNEGTYIVDNCCYLAGCDDDPDSNGWYEGTSTTISVNCVSMSAAQMKSRELLDALNVSGDAYVQGEDGYPVLRWETGNGTACTISIEQGTGGTVSAGASQVKAGSVVYLSAEADTGWVFRSFACNGMQLPHDYVTVTTDSVITASFESMKAGVLKIPHNDACTVSVTKTGTAEVDGVLTDVTDYPVENGDVLYENDVLTATAVWNEGTYPDDPDLVYISMVNPSSNNAFLFSFTYATAEEYESDDFEAAEATKTSHTVTSAINDDDVSLYLTAVPQTTNKAWSHIADTSWYSEELSEFTLTSAAQLAGLIRLVGTNGISFEGKTISLGCDISLANADGTDGIRWWDGIGSASTAFAGTFDGCGYKIYDMTAKSTASYIGLFRYCSGAEIRNVTVSGSACSYGGTAGLVSQGTDTAIVNCKAFVTTEDVGTVGIASGIAARLSGTSSVTGCANYCSVSGRDKLGGIVGEAADEGLTVTDCVNYGTIIGTTAAGGTGGIGGVVGRFASAATVTRCANYGEISGGAYYMGGVIGYANGATAGTVAAIDCANYGDVTNTGTNSSCAAGGIVGYFNYCTLSNCFDYGTVSGTTDYCGALIGRDAARSASKVSNCYYLNTAYDYASASADKAGADAVTAAQCASDSTFLSALNADGCYVRTNGIYPELQCAVSAKHTHSGGTATCVTQAVCNGCALPYGEVDPNNHPQDELTLQNVKDAIWTEQGYSGDMVCLACGKIAEQGIATDPDLTTVVFRVYERSGSGESVLKKEFTALEMNALYEACADGVKAYQYWGNGTGSEATETLVVSTRYVTLETLFAAAGVSFASDDSIQCGSNPAVAYDALNESCWYFESETEKTEVPAVVSFATDSASYPTSEVTDASVQSLAESAKITGQLRLCYGAKANEYGSVGGFRLLSGITEITVIHPEGTLQAGDVNGDGSITIADINLLIRYVNGKTGLSGFNLKAADYNGDGTVDRTDITELMAWYRSN